MPTEFRLSTVGFIMLATADLQRAVKFYRDMLRLDLSASTDEFAFFNAGGITLVISTALARSLDGKPGAVEVVFSVASVEAAYRALRDRELQFTHSPHSVAGTNWAANFTDLDGHALSLFGPE